MNVNLHNVEFIRSAASKSGFIFDSMPKIAFAGKSNVGKSSTINALLNRKNFARVGDSPGKTVHVNYFLIDKKVYFVDLPGYGFAKVSKEEQQRWGSLMDSFFTMKNTVDFSVLIVDLRHAPTTNDYVMCNFLR